MKKKISAPTPEEKASLDEKANQRIKRYKASDQFRLSNMIQEFLKKDSLNHREWSPSEEECIAKLEKIENNWYPRPVEEWRVLYKEMFLSIAETTKQTKKKKKIRTKLITWAKNS